VRRPALAGAGGWAQAWGPNSEFSRGDHGRQAAAGQAESSCGRPLSLLLLLPPPSGSERAGPA
jgi:hypothetical protein